MRLHLRRYFKKKDRIDRFKPFRWFDSKLLSLPVINWRAHKSKPWVRKCDDGDIRSKGI